MRTYLAAFFVALVVAGCLTPLVCKLAYRLGATSHPGGRHINSLAVPRLGGLALSAATLSPIVALFIVDSEVARIIRVWKTSALALVVGAFFMCLVGAWDDARGLRAGPKLAAQVVAAAFAFAYGFRIDGLLVPFFGSVALGEFAPLVTVLWIVGITNAVNLIDGLDGLAAGVVFFAAATNLIVALLSGPGLGSVFVCLVMASLMGALFGFLFYNFNPARIFMGDSGSYFLGYTLALTSLLSPIQKASTAVSLVIPVLALGLPIFDTLLSIARRYIARKPVFSADRGHIHHRLLDRGLTHRRTVVTLYGITFLFAGFAIATTIGRAWIAGMAVLGASAVLFGLVRFLGYFDSAQQAVRVSLHTYDPLTEQLRHMIPNLVLRLNTAVDRSTLEHALIELISPTEVLGIRCAEADLSGTDVTAATRGGPATNTDFHWESFTYEADTLVVKIKVENARAITATSLTLLQVLADVVHTAAGRLGSVEMEAAKTPTAASE
jgi:UDP-GlcNAc:undecaprenyl-phosphate/decaprenyl-phosphate GlcNAc-1-phosphate transferase